MTLAGEFTFDNSYYCDVCDSQRSNMLDGF